MSDPQSSSPVISVVIPAYNPGEFLAPMLDSVLSQVEAPPYEVIVVDDGSTDGTLEVLRGYEPNIRVLAGRHKGVGAARNRGIRQARGEWLCMPDSDDLLLPHALQTLYDAVHNVHDAVVAFGDYSVLKHGTVHLHTRSNVAEGLRPVQKVFRETAFAAGTGILRREMVERVGLFNERAPLAEDFALYARLAMHGRFIHIPDVLLHYRQHDNMTSRSGAMNHLWLYRMQRNVLRTYRKSNIHLDPAFLREVMSDVVVKQAQIHYWKRSRQRGARRLLLAATLARPTRAKLWAYLVMSLLPRRVLLAMDQLRSKPAGPPQSANE